MSLVPCVTVRSTVVGAAPFFCPTCGGDRPAQIYEGRRWVRIGGLPLVPLGRGPGHVTCVDCQSRHPLEVLHRLTTAELAHQLEVADRTLALMIVRTGDPTDRGMRRRAVQHIRSLDPTFDQNQLDLELISVQPARAADAVSPLRDDLEVEGKERLIADLVRVALAAHTITSHQRWVIETAGTTLGLTPLHLTGIISGIAAEIEPPADRT